LEPINLHARDLALADGGKKGIKNTTGSPECPPNVEAHRVEPEEGGQEEVVHQHGWNEKKAASYYLCAAEIYNSGDPFKAGRARFLPCNYDASTRAHPQKHLLEMFFCAFH
jgi:hypothetical protein